ncbi:MAG: choice-of-anchor D domain-containing protein, partial [Solirubrobacteraceae bacterium]
TPSPWLERSVQGLKFGRVRVGVTSPAQTVTLTNVGSAPMTISAIAKEGTNPDDFVGLTETCTALGTLGPGQSCSASVAFHPTATGTRAATLTMTDTAPRNPHHVALSGTGT